MPPSTRSTRSTAAGAKVSFDVTFEVEGAAKPSLRRHGRVPLLRLRGYRAARTQRNSGITFSAKSRSVLSEG